MHLFEPTDLANYPGPVPFFTHPYEHFRTYGADGPANLLDKMAGELASQSVVGFDGRLSEARQNARDSKNFFGFMTELKVASALHLAGQLPQFIESSCDPSPDIHAGGVYIEVSMPLKWLPELVRLQEELQNIDSRFCFSRRFGRKPKICSKEIYDRLKPILQESAGKALTTNPTLVWGNPAKEMLYGLLEDPHRECDVDLHNAHGSFEDAAVVFLKEAVNAKIRQDCRDSQGNFLLKNDLHNCHPNLLWSELLFLEEFQTCNLQRINWTNFGLPKALDAQLVTVCGIDSRYGDPEKPSRQVMLINCQASQQNIETIRTLISKSFPQGFQEITLSKYEEQLDLLS